MEILGDLSLAGGQLQNARHQLYTALPAYNDAVDRGREIFVTTGVNTGFWKGASDGSARWCRVQAVDQFVGYTGTVNAGSFGDLLLTASARRGMILKANIWMDDPASSPVNLSIPCRVACFPDETRKGRERIWEVPAVLRKTYAAVNSSSGDTVIEANDGTGFAAGDLLRLRTLSLVEEYARILSVAFNNFTLYEGIVTALSSNDLYLQAAEFTSLPFWNLSPTPANVRDICLRFYNDGASAVKFGYNLWVASVAEGLVQ